ncbi:MAG: hypothetical protein ACD_11C00106G0015 [uncultured bacterium]|nr:MAG: hypothetical protein ACD_11C00106G0015 [uncultured bacterium]
MHTVIAPPTRIAQTHWSFTAPANHTWLLLTAFFLFPVSIVPSHSDSPVVFLRIILITRNMGVSLLLNAP